MLKAVRYLCLVALPLVVALFIGAGSASAASNRAEYVAQVDPICQSYAGPLGSAYGAYNGNYKHWVRDASKGSLKGWIKQTKRLARSLSQVVQVHTALTDQIQAVPPPPEDAAIVSTWINDRRQMEASGRAAATALSHIDVTKFFKLGKQADAAEAAGINAISGLGFHSCGFSV